jgi:hypothetical protein
LLPVDEQAAAAFAAEQAIRAGSWDSYLMQLRHAIDMRRKAIRTDETSCWWCGTALVPGQVWLAGMGSIKVVEYTGQEDGPSVWAGGGGSRPASHTEAHKFCCQAHMQAWIDTEGT